MLLQESIRTVSYVCNEDASRTYKKTIFPPSDISESNSPIDIRHLVSPQTGFCKTSSSGLKTVPTICNLEQRLQTLNLKSADLRKLFSISFERKKN